MENIVYLVKPLSIDYGFDHDVGEKLQIGVYIAKNQVELEKIEKNLRSIGYRNIKVDEVKLDSLKYPPFLFRQKFV